ncbi:NAD(P)/FAD-dependent oxidoreductase [Streptomyces sp. CA-250714]|uniref:NAD(P)/FAD-dependent oxidoreductase n=1 Tax=Streptomyces sp. CA-250714 TaxID=3240060 RepID=UPI003D8F219F
MEYDVVVVGGGTAGLSAALTLARAGRRLAVVDQGEPRNAPAGHLHGFLSRDGMPPGELIEVGRSEIAGYGAELVSGRVREAAPGAEYGFTVRLETGRLLRARALLVATGLRDVLPQVPGVAELWGSGVLHCPYCHGHEVRGTPIGVLGGENRPFSVHQASLVRQWSEDVVFFPREIELDDEERERLLARGVRIVEGDVERLEADGDSLTGVRMADGRMVPRAALFVGPRFEPRDELLIRLGCEVGPNGWVAVDPSGRTSVPGVWGAGNVVSESAQLASAAGMGMSAGIALNHYLLADDIEGAVARYRMR